uniref:trypsin n=1 Tax=Paramormyrops kingsleyae TaxID=1676925 RepID=A0A3B3SCP6_9TELE
MCSGKQLISGAVFSSPHGEGKLTSLSPGTAFISELLYEDDDDGTEEDDLSLDWLYDLLGLSDPCDPNPCDNKGVCEVDGGSFKCVCPEPYRGKKCHRVKKVCKRHRCLHGECVITSTPPYYACICRVPYKPPDCKISSPCDPDPCLNGGTCVKDTSTTSFHCECPANFTGQFCEVSPDDCYEANGESYRGFVSETEQGDICLPWNAYFIIVKDNNPLHEYSGDNGLGTHNYCRNPDEDSRPWCYVRDKNKLMWDYCDTRKCPRMVNVTDKKIIVKPPEGDFSTCGEQSSISPRILGGRKALPGAYPWQASFQVREKGSFEKFSHDCGGILIRSCWVLTAAHCIEEHNDMRVVLGTLNIKREDPNTQALNVVEAIIHEKYRETSSALYNDIALLRLQDVHGHCANETDFVKTACLPDRAFPDGMGCTISGWGATENTHVSSQLLHARVVLISQQRCMGENVYGDVLDDSMLCAGHMKGGVDSCQGDSGGPLTCERDGRHYVYGVVSWGDSCGLRNKPGIYARVTHFLDWISSKLPAL